MYIEHFYKEDLSKRIVKFMLNYLTELGYYEETSYEAQFNNVIIIKGRKLHIWITGFFLISNIYKGIL